MASMNPPEDINTEDLEDNYEVGNYTFVGRVQHWTGGSIDPHSIYSLQIALVLESGKQLTATRRDSKVAQQEDFLLEKYKELAKQMKQEGIVTTHLHECSRGEKSGE